MRTICGLPTLSEHSQLDPKEVTIQTTETMERLIAPEAPEYVTIEQAAGALASRSWPVAKLVESGELRAVDYQAPVAFT